MHVSSRISPFQNFLVSKMSRSAAVDDQEGDADRRARGQAAGGGSVDGRPPKPPPPPPMRSMSREDSCASNSAAVVSDSRNANGARILLAHKYLVVIFSAISIVDIKDG